MALEAVFKKIWLLAALAAFLIFGPAQYAPWHSLEV